MSSRCLPAQGPAIVFVGETKRGFQVELGISDDLLQSCGFGPAEPATRGFPYYCKPVGHIFFIEHENASRRSRLVRNGLEGERCRLGEPRPEIDQGVAE